MGKSWKIPIKVAVAQKKGKLFNKLAKEITVAARLGGPDPDFNPRLKMAIQAAKKASCPNDTIERAIKKGSGQLEGATAIEEVTYEGYGPHGVGIIVECQTDNKNRTVAEIRNLFKKHGGNMGDTGAVSWMFDRVALVEGHKQENVDDPEVDAIEAGAEEVEQSHDGGYSFYGQPQDLEAIRKALMERGWEISVAELSYKAKNLTSLDQEQREQAVQLLQALEDFEDSHRVHATID